jgi:hypothetical protein
MVVLRGKGVLELAVGPRPAGWLCEGISVVLKVWFPIDPLIVMADDIGFVEFGNAELKVIEPPGEVVPLTTLSATSLSVVCFTQLVGADV